MLLPKTLVLIGIVVGSIIIGIGISYEVCINACQNTNQGMVGSMMGNGMMSGMMSDVPQDVIIKAVSSQQVPVGKEAQVTLLVLDKNTKEPISSAQVVIGIEKGAPMSTMNMVTPMFEADNVGNGKYVARFTIDDTTGYYTMHTHVILSGESMHSMMQNHMDIGILAK